MGLILTLGLMAIGTFTIAATPGYAAIGLAAPAIVRDRTTPAGGSPPEWSWAASSIYLAEDRDARQPRLLLFVAIGEASSWRVIFTALLGLSRADDRGCRRRRMGGPWGWRLPLFVGCAIIPLILWLRRSLQGDRGLPAEPSRTISGRGISKWWAPNWRLVLLGMMLSVLTTTTFYSDHGVYADVRQARPLHLKSAPTA